VLTYSPSLDGIRGLAILLVMAHHLSIVRSDVPFDANALALLHNGWVGVDLFFVLSGFLITGILIDARDSDRYFVSFYARRTLRIIPLYYLIVFLSYHVLPYFPTWYLRLVGQGDIPPEEYFWTFLSNFVFAERDQLQHGILTVVWSLAIEEQFYLLWAVVVWVCPPRWLGRVCAAMVVGVPLLRAWAAAGDASVIEIHVQTQYRADTLAAGAWLAWRSRQPGAAEVFRFAPWAVLLGIAGVVGLTWWDGHPVWDTWGKQSLGFSFLALAASGALLCVHARPARSWWVRAFSAGWLRSIGRYSYCLYLIHLPVMWTMKYLVFDPTRMPRLAGSAMPAQALFWVVAFIPAYALAWVSWRCLEEPLLRLKRFFPY
jgi:peptidoglycan/LPS O-acetylase OafA/YrhL